MSDGIESWCPHCGTTAALSQALDATCTHCGTKLVPITETVSIGAGKRSPEHESTVLFPQLPKRSQVTSGTEPASDGGARPLQPGDAISGTLGRFELKIFLGRGAFGQVFRAFDPVLDRDVALKVPSFGPDEQGKVERFFREAKAAGRLRHSNIVAIYERGRAGDGFYIASEFIDGEPLSAVLQRGTPGRRTAVEWVRAMADGLAYAHSQGVVHRDIKPSNTMIDRQGRPQIMDFGLAKRIEDDSQLTADGTILGTPAYMSPEQCRGGRDVGPASDQYSLGVVLYRVLCGRTPFDGTPDLQIFQHLQKLPPPPRAHDPGIPRDLEAICLKTLEKDASRRYASVGALAEDLDRWLRGEPTLARPLGPAERAQRWVRRNPVLSGAASTVFVVTATCLLFVLAAWRSASLDRDAARKAEKQAGIDRNAALASAAAEHEAVRVARRQLHVAQSGLIERAWMENRIGRVRELLAAQIPASDDQDDLRGWEWHWQDRMCRQELAVRKIGGGFFAISSDGRRIAVAGTDHTIRLLDLDDPAAPAQVLVGHDSEIQDLAFHPQGHRLASSDREPSQTIRYWDLTTGKLLWSLPGLVHGAYCDRVSFTRDGSSFALGGKNGAVVLEATDSLPKPRFFTPGDFSRASTISPDGKYVAAGSLVNTCVRIWDSSGKLLHEVPRIEEPQDIAFDVTSSLLAVASVRGAVSVIDVATGAIRWKQTLPDLSIVAALAIHPQKNWVVTGGNDTTIRFWNLKTGRPGPVLRGHEAPIRDLAFDSNGECLYSSDNTSVLRKWDVASAGADRVLVRRQDTIRRILIDQAATHMALIPRLWDPNAPLRDQTKPGAYLAPVTVCICDASTGELRHSFTQHSDCVFTAALSPAGDLLAVGLRDGKIVLWNAATGARRLEINAHAMYTMPAGMRLGVQALAFESSGQTLVSFGADRCLRAWDVATGQLRQERQYEGHLAIAPNGRYGAVQSGDGVALFDPATGHVVRTVSSSAAGEDLLFDQSSEWLVGVANQRLSLWNVATGELRFQTHSPNVRNEACAVSPDAKRLFIASQDHSVKIWDIQTGQEVRTLFGSTLTLFPDGQRLAVGEPDGTLRIYDARPLTPAVREELNRLPWR